MEPADNPFATSESVGQAPLGERHRTLEQTRIAVWASAVLTAVPGGLLMATGTVGATSAGGWLGWLGMAGVLLGMMILALVAQLLRFASALGRLLQEPSPRTWSLMLQAERNTWLTAATLSIFSVLGVLARFATG